MPETTPTVPETATDLSRFDDDPDALTWARAKIQHAIDRAAGFEAHCRETGNIRSEVNWRTVRQFMSQTLIGGRGCVIGAFDERLPEMRRLMADPDEVAW